MWPWKPPQLTKEESLRCRPVRNSAVNATVNEKGEVVITLPRRKTRWVSVLARVFYAPSQHTIVLDELGSFVWKLCDGQATVGKVIEVFAERHKLNRREAELSVTTFLRQLAKKGLIGLAVPPSAAKRLKGKG